MDFESCNPAAQFAIQQSQNSFVIPNATPFIEFDLNVLATGHVGLTIRIFDVTQPSSFAVLNRVQQGLAGRYLVLQRIAQMAERSKGLGERTEGSSHS